MDEGKGCKNPKPRTQKRKMTEDTKNKKTEIDPYRCPQLPLASSQQKARKMYTYSCPPSLPQRINLSSSFTSYQRYVCPGSSLSCLSPSLSSTSSTWFGFLYSPKTPSYDLIPSVLSFFIRDNSVCLSLPSLVLGLSLSLSRSLFSLFTSFFFPVFFGEGREREGRRRVCLVFNLHLM